MAPQKKKEAAKKLPVVQPSHKMVYMQRVDVETLVFNSHNVRAIFRTPEEIQRIAKTLLDPGLIHHPVGSLLPDGQILVCAG